MKIISHGNVATVTFIGKTGILATVGHFYRGDPVLIDYTIPVQKILLSTKYDYFIGYSSIRMGARLAPVYPKKGMTVIINDKHYTIIDILDDYTWEVNGYFVQGQSGTPIYNEEGAIIGYIIANRYARSIVPVLKAIREKVPGFQDREEE